MPQPKFAPTTDRLRAALLALRAAGVEMVMQDGPTPISLTEDAMVLLPGAAQPIPAKDVIGFQSAFTRKMQALADREREVAALEKRAAGAMKLVEDFDEDPWGTLEDIRGRIVTAAENQGVPVPPEWAAPPKPQSQSPAPVPGAGPTGGEGGGSMSPGMETVIGELMKRMVSMEQHLNGMGAKLDVKEGLAVLERDHPDLMKDPDFRQKMAQRAEVSPGLGLTDLFRLTDYENKDTRIKSLEAELLAAKRDMILGTPTLGFGRNSGVAGRKDVDEDEALKASWMKTIEENLEV